MSRKQEIVTGAFVLGGIALVAAGALWLAGAGIGRHDRVLTALFEAVGQVKPGNPVTLRGVAVGKVASVTLADGEGVEVVLRVRPDVELPPDPVVVLQPVSLFGEWQAVIVPASVRPGLRREVLELPADRLPGITLAAFADISENSREIAENLRGLTERLEIAFSDTIAEELAATVRNLSRASDQVVRILEQQRQDFGEFTATMADVAEVVQKTVGDLDATISRLAAATEEGELEAIFANAREASASFREVAGHLRGTVEELDRAIARADSALGEVHGLLGAVNRGEGSIGLLAQDQILYENTVATVAELRALLDDLKRNPRKYFNFSVF